ncbi:archaeosortase/exosortase family protein [Candidatus Micrarchaeota archaeon]|nr:archaeosortase/exosortase family protein [Candidatus Micrarchaeota archaeon]MBU2475865.1 archaeosortase/exosortase family protein [Candidatus Micrarchaeota archaeon]
MDKKDAVKGGKFLLVLIGVYVFLSVLFYLIPLEWIEFVIAKTVVLFSGGKIVSQEPVLILFENFTIQISYLCTGLMEFILLASALAATEGVENKKKVLGIIGAGIATFLFNITRIIITISLISTSSMQTIELAHNVLFRVSLFVLIAGYYFFWYYFSVKK